MARDYQLQPPPPSTEERGRGLSPKQKRFVELVVLEGMNGQEAYENAGYRARGNAAKTSASRLLTDANAKAYRAELEEERTRASILKSFELDHFLSQIITTPIGEIDENSPLCVAYKIRRMEGKDGEGPTEEIIEVKKADPLRAVDQLKKTFGDYAPEKVEHTHNGLETLFGDRKPAPGLEHDSHG